MKLKYFSQYQQDQFLDSVLFNKKDKGFFIEIGAHDGISYSNSLFFEKYRNWKGICIEPNPAVFEILIKNRQSLNLNICIGDDNTTVKFTQIIGYSNMLSGVTSKYDTRHLQRIKEELNDNGGEMNLIDVPMKRLESLSEIKNKKIDFISIDTEGNEFEIVKSIDFEKVKVKVLIIENNYKEDKLSIFLRDKKFILLTSLATDEVYVYKDFLTFRMKCNLLLWNSKKRLYYNLNRIKKKLSK